MIKVVGSGLCQWDTGRTVTVTDSGANKVHFANPGDSHAPILDLADGVAKIPDYLLMTGKPLCVYAVQDGVTLESRAFPVKKRERPENYVYEDDQRNYIYELISYAQAATKAANKVAQDLLKAKENGEFDGKDAECKVKTVNGIEPDENGNVQVEVDLSNYFTKDEMEQIVEEMDIPTKAYVYEEAERVAKNVVSKEIGDISTALDELHAYAETLKGGEAG